MSGRRKGMVFVVVAVEIEMRRKGIERKGPVETAFAQDLAIFPKPTRQDISNSPYMETCHNQMSHPPPEESAYLKFLWTTPATTSVYTSTPSMVADMATLHLPPPSGLGLLCKSAHNVCSYLNP